MIGLKRFFFAVWAIPAAALLALGGCASVQPVPEKAGRAAPFDVLGRVLVHFEGNAVSANVRWLHAQDRDEIWLMTPTGQALAHLREDTNGAVLTGADKSQYSAARAEALTKQGLGWEFPMARLQHWIRGVPMPNTPFETTGRDADGKYRTIAQDGWKITYDYYAAAENDGLPRRMEVAGAGQTLRLVIDTWRKETP